MTAVVCCPGSLVVWVGWLGGFRGLTVHLSLTQALLLCCGALTCCCCCCCCFFCCGTCCPPKEDESYKYVDPKDLEAQMRAEEGGESGWSPAGSTCVCFVGALGCSPVPSRVLSRVGDRVLGWF